MKAMIILAVSQVSVSTIHLKLESWPQLLARLLVTHDTRTPPSVRSAEDEIALFQMTSKVIMITEILSEGILFS